RPGGPVNAVRPAEHALSVRWLRGHHASSFRHRSASIRWWSRSGNTKAGCWAIAAYPGLRTGKFSAPTQLGPAWFAVGLDVVARRRDRLAKGAFRLRIFSKRAGHPLGAGIALRISSPRGGGDKAFLRERSILGPPGYSRKCILTKIFEQQIFPS